MATKTLKYQNVSEIVHLSVNNTGAYCPHFPQPSGRYQQLTLEDDDMSTVISGTLCLECWRKIKQSLKPPFKGTWDL